MDKTDLKPHWIKLMNYAKLLNNVKFSLEIQDGVPVKVKIKELKQEEFDLTKWGVIWIGIDYGVMGKNTRYKRKCCLSGYG